VRGLLHIAFGIAPEDAAYERLFARFLELYAANLCVHTRLFPGMNTLLDRIEAAQAGWGIVTNKRRRYTDPLVAQLGLTPRTPCVVSGDTTAAAKPSPLPVLHACQLLNVEPVKTWFVGDDPRDIEAGRAAGCRTVAVTWGYLANHAPTETWGADLVVHTPDELAKYLRLPVLPK
jgi:phosphoglycolate phosphatase